jgi:SAM-dependent methyltransferase
VIGSSADVGQYKKEFWSKESSKFSKPHYRLEKGARILNKLAGTRECTLLDVGCGPATLRHLLSPNIHYFGIDIAIPEAAPNLVEADIVQGPISFGDKRFDIITAQGLFEYLGDHQAAKFAEIADLLAPDGTFVVTYTNFAHRKPEIYEAYSNVRPLEDFRQSLAREFVVRNSFPTSYNWAHGQPVRKLVRAANMPLNVNLPFIGSKLAVEYFFICSGRGTRASQARTRRAPDRELSKLSDDAGARAANSEAL